MIFCESLIKNKKATQCAAYIKQLRFSENQKECERFVRTPFFDLLLGKRLCATLHILSSVSYQIKQEKFSHDFSRPFPKFRCVCRFFQEEALQREISTLFSSCKKQKTHRQQYTEAKAVRFLYRTLLF